MYKVRLISSQQNILQQTMPLPDYASAVHSAGLLLQQYKAPVVAEILCLSRADGIWVEKVQERISKQFDFPA